MAKTLSEIADDLELAMRDHERAWNENGKNYGPNVAEANDRISKIYCEYAAYINKGKFAGNDQILKHAGRLTTFERNKLKVA